MNRTRYLALAAEAALASGRPLHEALEAAAAPVGITPREQAAIAHAREGRLEEALRLLRADPLVSLAARLSPAAAPVVSRRLASFPQAFESTARLDGWVAYLGIVFAVELVASWAMARISPGMERDFGMIPASASARMALVLAIGVVAVLLLVVRPLAARRLREARAAAAAAALLEEGLAPAEVAQAFADRGFRTVPALVAACAHDPFALARLAGVAHARAEAGLGRLVLRLRTAGLVLAFVPAFLLLASAYGWMSGLANGVAGWP